MDGQTTARYPIVVLETHAIGDIFQRGPCGAASRLQLEVVLGGIRAGLHIIGGWLLLGHFIHEHPLPCLASSVCALASWSDAMCRMPSAVRILLHTAIYVL